MLLRAGKIALRFEFGIVARKINYFPYYAKLSRERSEGT